MVKHATIPAENLSELDLHDGDKIAGEVHDGIVSITVVVADTQRKSSGIGFAKRWRGKFKGLLDQDHSDDPRAEYLLNR